MLDAEDFISQLSAPAALPALSLASMTSSHNGLLCPGAAEKKINAHSPKAVSVLTREACESSR